MKPLPSIPERAFFEIMDTLPVGVFVVQKDGKPVYANQTAQQILGKGIVEDAGPDQFADVYKAYVMDTNDEYPADKMPIVRALHGIASEVENIDIHRPDGVLTIQVWGAPVFHEGELTFAVAAFQDITERREIERRLAVYHELTDVLYGLSGNVETEILKAIGDGLKWEIGILWKVDGDTLRFSHSWVAADAVVSDFEILSRKLAFEKGMGLPGRVWETDKPVWILNVVEDRNFIRTPAALKNGLHAAFAFPVRSEDRITGVIEFFSKKIYRIDRDLLIMLGGKHSRFSRLIDVKLKVS